MWCKCTLGFILRDRLAEHGEPFQYQPDLRISHHPFDKLKAEIDLKTQNKILTEQKSKAVEEIKIVTEQKFKAEEEIVKLIAENDENQ